MAPLAGHTLAGVGALLFFQRTTVALRGTAAWEQQRLCGAAALWRSGLVVRQLCGTVAFGLRCDVSRYSLVAQRQRPAQQLFVVQLRGTAAWEQRQLCGTAAL